MKKIEIKGKLSLNKSTIANLNDQQMHLVKGGVDGAGGDTELGKAAKTWFLSRCMFSNHPTCNDHNCDQREQ